MSKKYLKSNKAFTLVELIVVIAVLAIISGILLLQIKPASVLMKARDSKRMQDIDQISKALNLGIAEGEITLTANPSSCTSCSSLSGTQAVDGSGFVKFTIPTGKTGMSKYLPTLPMDPTNSGSYVYKFGSTTTDFELNAVLESADNASMMSTDGGNSSTTYEKGSNLNIL